MSDIFSNILASQFVQERQTEFQLVVRNSGFRLCIKLICIYDWPSPGRKLHFSIKWSDQPDSTMQISFLRVWLRRRDSQCFRMRTLSLKFAVHSTQQRCSARLLMLLSLRFIRNYSLKSKSKYKGFYICQSDCLVKASIESSIIRH